MKPCLCKKGKDYHMAGTEYEIIRCNLCGCKAAHIKCGKLDRKAPGKTISVP